MKILVYGCGVIGPLLVHTLCKRAIFVKKPNTGSIGVRDSY